MTDPAGQQDPYAPQGPYPQQGYGWPQQYPGAGGPVAARYVPPTLNDVWYKATLNMVLFALTCGLWGAAWAYRTHDDLQKHNGDGIGGGVGLVLGLLAGVVIRLHRPDGAREGVQPQRLAEPG